MHERVEKPGPRQTLGSAAECRRRRPGRSRRAWRRAPSGFGLSDSYQYWERQRSRKNFKFGQFGANFMLEGLADDEQHRMISNVMSKLTPGLRRALELREFDERSIKETARMMGISIELVKSRVFRGRRELCWLLDRPKPGPMYGYIGSTAPKSRA